MPTLMALWRRFRRWLRVQRAPYRGTCGHCGRPVRHHYPWFTNNPDRGGQPLHDNCAVPYFSFDD